MYQDPFRQTQFQNPYAQAVQPQQGVGYSPDYNPYASFFGGGQYGEQVGPGNAVGQDSSQSGPKAVDTTGQFSGFGIGNMAMTAMPGGSFGKAANAFGQAFAGGPFGVQDWDNSARPGSAAWGHNMAARREAQRRNQNWGRQQRSREAIEAGRKSSYSNTAPGRRGARDGGGAQDRGGPQGNSNDIRDSGSF